MFDVEEGEVVLAPEGEEFGDVGFCVGVIAFAPTGVIDRLLEVDRHEEGVGGKGFVGHLLGCEGDIKRDRDERAASLSLLAVSLVSS